MNLYSAIKYFNAERQRSRGADEDEENSVSLSLCDKTHPRPREVVAVIISREVREVREVFILLSLLGDLEFWRFGVLESSFNTEAQRHREERELDA